MMTLDEFTPEKVRELTDERDAVKRGNYNRLSVERLRQECEAGERAWGYLQTRRQLRAMSLRNNGMSVSRIAEWFGVSVGTVRGWLRSDVTVVLTGGEK